MPVEARFKAAYPYQQDVLALPVTDLDAASLWYREHFGMVEVERLAEPMPAVIMERDGTRLGFAIRGGDASQDGAAILVTNIEGMKEEFVACAITSTNPSPPDAPALSSSQCRFPHAPFVAELEAHKLTTEAGMRKLRIFEHTSLDGVIQHSRDEDDFPYGDWTAPYRSPAGAAAVAEAQGERFDLLLGRRTYDLWSSYWPTVKGGPFGGPINAATKYVATHRPDSLAWGPVESLGDDIVEGVRRLKAADGADLIVWGSSTLTPLLLDQGLADELVLMVYPVLLGRGKRFFSDRIGAHEFALASTQATPTGLLVNTYRHIGALRAAS